MDFSCTSIHINLWKAFYVIILCTFLSLHLVAQTDTKGQASIVPSSTSMAISVTIGGDFITNGTFPALLTERVDQFITRIYEQKRAEELELAKLGIEIKGEGKRTREKENMMFQNYALRGIILKRNSGEQSLIDIDKFRLTGDFKYNPYLKNDDILIFPQYDKDNTFSVEGAVNNPGTFQFVEGDKIEDGLLFARGIDPLYENADKLEIYRLTYDGRLDTVIRMPLDKQYPLKRGDRVRFVATEPLRKNYRAFVDGEVMQPGVAFVTKEGLPLFKVLEQVGGLREDADLSRAELIRGGNVFQSIYYGSEFERMMMQRMAPIKAEDSLTFLVDNVLRTTRGAWAQNLEGLKSERIDSLTILVRDGDYLFIPQKIDFVYVFGQVNNFGYIKYIPGKDYSYYITQAGGIGATAKKDIYIIKNRTRAWYLASKSNIAIEPGDYIWVPKKPVKDFDYYLQRVAYIGSIVTGIVTTALLIVQVTK